QLFDFSKDSRCLSFHALAHSFVVCLSELAGLVFEVEVAQVIVDNVLALVEVGEPCLVHAGLEVAAGHEDKDQGAGGKRAAEQLNRDLKSLRTHISVSWRARARRASRCGSSGAGAAACECRSRHRRIKNAATSSPVNKIAKGMIHASSSNPRVPGSTTAVTPQFSRNHCKTFSSSSTGCSL